MFTETYIEMVTKAKEIQALCKYNKGDWFWNGEKPYLYCKSGLGSSNPHDYKWLPALEDLFGIFKPDAISDICYELATDEDGIDGVNELYEKLLKWVMLANYGKEWNPAKKEWEEINGIK